MLQGNIASITTNTSVTIEGNWTPINGTPTIDGTNDKIYKYSPGSSASFGELSDVAVSTTTIAFRAVSELPNGYTVKMRSDGDLTNGSHTIPGVADGAVTAGSEEYGARSSDNTIANSTFDTQDTAITTDFQDIASQSGWNSMSQDYYLTLKASKAATTPSGTYAQTLTFIASGNF